AHQAFDPCLAHARPLSLQHPLDARAAVRLTAIDEDFIDALAQRLIGAHASTRCSSHERVVALPRNPEHTAEHRDRELRLLRVDERELHSLSFAKKAAAFFRISRSISSCSTRLRRRAFSFSNRAA